MAGTTITPEDLKRFAKEVDKLADDLEDRKRPASRLCKVMQKDKQYPTPGVFESAAAFSKAYDEKLSGMRDSLASLHSVLRGLADATREVSRKYQSTEDYNSATSEDIHALLGKPGADGSEPDEEKKD